MDEVKDKVKGFMKKVNNPFSSSSSSSSGKFKGQGRVLGSSSSSIDSDPSSKPNRSSNPPYLNPNPSPRKTVTSNNVSKSQPDTRNDPKPSIKQANVFDPFDSMITSGKRSKVGYSLNVFECPVCNKPFRSEEEVTNHVESCIDSNSADNNDHRVETKDEIAAPVDKYLSGNPSEASVEIVLKLMRNIITEPENAKYRRIRLSNPKIREAIGEVVGGVELLEFVGFNLGEEGNEMWAAMEVPTEEEIVLIKKVISLLDKEKVKDLPSAEAPLVEAVELVQPEKIDREVRVFFSVPENVAANIELPDSFYKLSTSEVKREAEMRRKKIEESQLLIPKSYKEKQTQIARKRYKKTVIRIQFPDGVVLQGFFSPRESTTVLYEFVSSALKDPSLEFDLLHPVAIKRRVIPHFPTTTLEEEDLVPSALIKFRPKETDSVVFTGLSNKLLEISEPLLVG